MPSTAEDGGWMGGSGECGDEAGPGDGTGDDDGDGGDGRLGGCRLGPLCAKEVTLAAAAA